MLQEELINSLLKQIWCLEIQKKMTTGVDDMPDDILSNILSRLPVKPMVGRCRCVSKRWNALITDPNFMISRSPLIFLESYSDVHEYKTIIPIPINPIYILDESKESVTDGLDVSIFNLPPPEYDYDHQNRRSVTIVGTFSGIMLLVVTDYTQFYPSYHVDMNPHIILYKYNHATGVYDILDDDPNPPLYRDYDGHDHAYGFGYGATVDELKIVRCRKYHSNTWNVCEVLNLKTRSWSHPEVFIIQDASFEDLIGTFLKGYLYWIINEERKGNRYPKIVAFDVDKMVFSDMHLPDPAIDNEYNHLGTCHGCLWMITNTAVDTLNFDVWVMNINDQGVDNYWWSKTCSLTIGLEGEYDLDYYKIIEITDDGRIIIYVYMEDCPDIIIYDTLKHSYKPLDVDLEYLPKRGVKYKESLVSPMNICRARLI